MSFEKELHNELKSHGAEFIYFVDISHLDKEQNKGFSQAILFGVSFTPGYIRKVAETPDYIGWMKQNNKLGEDEFHNKEIYTDQLADRIAKYLISKGYKAYSQSEDNIEKTGFYDNMNNTTPLPHKTIAGYAGLGWIGKHDLLVTHKFGSAISMCSVLTDAPLNTVLYNNFDSQCGNCTVCVDGCAVNAIKGITWHMGISRDELVDVTKCSPCLRCLALCPFTQAYVRNQI